MKNDNADRLSADNSDEHRDQERPDLHGPEFKTEINGDRSSPPALDAAPVGNANDRFTAPPIIPSEPSDRIIVGGGDKLIVPREDIAADIDIGEELDLQDLQAKKIRKPGRREWFALHRESELTTRVLIHKPKADGIEVEHYYVDPKLRSPIRDELKEVRVFVFYSFTARCHALWIANVTVDNSWYESLAPLLARPAEFFQTNAIRVIPDKENSRYRIRVRPLPAIPAWPAKTTNELLGEALGADRFITTAEHPLFRDLVEGQELS